MAKLKYYLDVDDKYPSGYMAYLIDIKLSTKRTKIGVAIFHAKDVAEQCLAVLNKPDGMNSLDQTCEKCSVKWKLEVDKLKQALEKERLKVVDLEFTVKLQRKMIEKLRGEK